MQPGALAGSRLTPPTAGGEFHPALKTFSLYSQGIGWPKEGAQEGVLVLF